ncbi:MAG: terpene cyclase/mutase family protein [Thermoguttaceae bacterium]|nr:terpene cyclase/mutase family protein [Thermoguttaceae bacterium]
MKRFRIFGTAFLTAGFASCALFGQERVSSAQPTVSASISESSALSVSSKVDLAALDKAAAQGIEYLRTVQAEDGSFSSQMGTGLTSIAILGMLGNNLPIDDPMLSKAIDYLKSQAQPDGAIVNPNMGFGNYETSIGIVALAKARKAGRDDLDEILKFAERYLRKYQWDESEGLDSADIKYGGAGYGGRMSRPDLSNTGFMLDALHELGAGPDDEAVKKAVVFVSRCQGLESEHNALPFAKDGDGGFVYVIESQDPKSSASPMGRSKESLSTYGSMTYTGFKSLIYAGLTKEDKRVQTALEWLANRYSVTENPGQGDAGLFYYYIAMTKALLAYGVDTFRDANGTEHDWRAEITAQLIERQQEDGSWVNSNRRWMENSPVLVTGYALMILGNCR